MLNCSCRPAAVRLFPSCQYPEQQIASHSLVIVQIIFIAATLCHCESRSRSALIIPTCLCQKRCLFATSPV